jgi:hypothetical protein
LGVPVRLGRGVFGTIGLKLLGGWLCNLWGTVLLGEAISFGFALHGPDPDGIG